MRVIVTTGPGGQGDTTARLIAQKLSENLGQSFYVENVVGGGGNIAMAWPRAPRRTAIPSSRPAATSSSIRASTPRCPTIRIKDFAPVTLVCSSTHVLAVHPSVPAHSVGELIAVARANPGQLQLSRRPGRGTPAHLAGELFKLAFAADITHVPFNGGGPGLTATLGGHAPIIVSALPTGAPHAKAGTLRALALMSARRSSLAARRADHGGGHRAAARSRHPDRACCPGGNAEGDHRSPPSRDRQDHRAAGVPGAPRRARLRAVASTPEDFADWIKTEIAKWGKVIRDANIGVQ